jgi:hypothetical protein
VCLFSHWLLDCHKWIDPSIHPVKCYQLLKSPDHLSLSVFSYYWFFLLWRWSAGLHHFLQHLTTHAADTLILRHSVIRELIVMSNVTCQRISMLVCDPFAESYKKAWLLVDDDIFCSLQMSAQKVLLKSLTYYLPMSACPEITHTCQKRRTCFSEKVNRMVVSLPALTKSPTTTYLYRYSEL